MNYIVLDLEWNQCPSGKEKENEKLPFEIVEIGALKIDEKLNYIDSFSETIRPTVYKKLHYIMEEISKISIDELKNSDSFENVVNRFFAWAGKDCRFCTWGSLDLTEFQRNMQFYRMKRTFPFPLKYYDIQKLYSIDKEDGKIRRSLTYAANELKITEEAQFHRALNDAKYTYEVMRKINFDLVKTFYSIDCYYIPRNKKEEVYVRYLTYSKYISRKFNTKENALLDKEVSSLKCIECGKELKTIIPWFSDNAKIYYSLGYCDEHGYMKCKIRMRKNSNDQIYAVKTTKQIDQEGIQELEERQDIIREKRRERRIKHHDKDNE